MTCQPLRSGARAKLNRRMQMLAEGRHPRAVLASLLRESEVAGILGTLPVLRRLDRLLTRAGTKVSIEQALLGMALCSALSFVLLRLAVALPSALAALLAAALGVGLPVLFLIRHEARRLRLLEEQLPGALDLLVRNLRSGHPVNAALAWVAKSMPDPLGSELGIVVDEVTYGRALDEALERLDDRVDLPDLRALRIAVQIQDGGGGDLAHTLDGLARLSRSRSGTCSPTSSFSEA